jgi:hypothetical protein
MSAELPDDLPLQPAPAAFRRPGLVLLVAAYHLLAGLLVAAPIAALFNSSVSGYPRGDAELFDPGALMLIEALHLGARGIAATLTGAGLPGLVAIFGGLLPLAALIAGLSRRGRLSRAFVVRAATFRLGTLALLWGVGLAAQILLAVLVVLLGGKVIDTLHLRAKNEDIAYVVLAAVTGLTVLAAGVLRDLAAVAAVAGEGRFYVSMARALLTVIRRPGSVIGAYASRALLALALLVAAFELAPPRGESLGVAFALHEGAIVLGVFLRASWLAAALRLVWAAAPPHAPAPAAPVEPAPAPEPAPVNDGLPEETLASPVPEVEPVGDVVAEGSPEGEAPAAAPPVAPELEAQGGERAEEDPAG